MYRIEISRDLLANEGQDAVRDAHEIFEAALNEFNDDVAREGPTILKDLCELSLGDFYFLSSMVLREDVRDWLDDQGIEHEIRIAYYAAQAGRSEFYVTLDGELGKRPKLQLWFNCQVECWISDPSQATMFKLAWGGSC